MVRDVQFGIALLTVIAAVTLAGRRWQLPTPILLVPAGAALAFVPVMPRIVLDPDLVLLIILPPLVYSAGVATSWPDFRADLRSITLLAVGGVVFTTAVVAVVARWAVPLPWAPAFVFGAIISPPDVVAPMAVVGRLRVPRRLITILNGEGLVNDVTALVLVGFATRDVVTGSFSLAASIGTFVVVVAGELAWGVAVGWGALRARRWADDVRVEITLSLLTPYLAFWPPHRLGGSGVLAAATAGLYTSWRGPRLISAATRLQGTFFWNLIVYLLTGMVFLLTGLEGRVIGADVGRYGWGRLALAATAVCVVAVAARFAWVYFGTYVPPFAGRGPRPDWRRTFLVAFTGIRGVVSLTAALTIPLTVAGGAPFPGRDMILFLTFMVILATLVLQGLALPPVIRKLGLDRLGAEEARREEHREYETLAAVEARAVERLDGAAAEVGAPEQAATDVRSRHEGRRHHAELALVDPAAALRARSLELALIVAQRELAWERFASGAITDEARRRIEHELDLEEARVRREPNEAVPDGT